MKPDSFTLAGVKFNNVRMERHDDRGREAIKDVPVVRMRH